MVLGLTIGTQVFITTRIVDLKLYLAAFDVLRAPVHIQHGRLVLFRELIVEVVVNQACFTYGGISYENHLDLLWFTCWFRCGCGLFFHLLLNRRFRLTYSLTGGLNLSISAV